MLIRDIHHCRSFVALDGTELCELLHPAREDENLEMSYSIAYASVKPGRASKPHRLETSSEVYYILEGEGFMYIDDERAEVGPGQVIYIPPNSKQYIENIGYNDLKFLCIVSPMWRQEDEVLI